MSGSEDVPGDVPPEPDATEQQTGPGYGQPGTDPTAGYQQDPAAGHQQPGYGQPGADPAAGYQQPGYGQPGADYQQGGYGQPAGAYAAPGYAGYSTTGYYPYAGRGAIGQPRNWWAPPLLGLLTCGIYTLYWEYKSHEEVKLYSGQGIGGLAAVLLSALVCGFVSIFVLPAEIEKMYNLDGQQSPVAWPVGFWVLLPIAGSFVYYFKVQGAMNDFWQARGATTETL